MFSTHAFTALLALAISPLVARADVTPLTPAPGDSFNAGATCTTTWTGDSNSTMAWKGMAIELMTGANLDMIHLSTVATNQDGTQSGTFSFPCPAVTLNAPIYFFQYSAPGTTVKEWTTRFTIASSSGQTVAAPNATQPGPGGADIPWGAGALQDPSAAVAAPSFAAEGGDGSAAVPAGTSTTSASDAAKSATSSTPSGMVTQLTTSSSTSKSASDSATKTTISVRSGTEERNGVTRVAS
ncbi:hypothetical protein CPB84DRAFT_1812996 [Gymnopilus junonius]|uniref:Yeast cell wall synthesis Kre9/Knh1-like N-terminal domain-containing protein n=1 Tax=Gymnopilus junonius TaxID=109634 RepID=A0A9P5TRC4_GYMJU|nr:hypothetical protein CPB84DRAFT_1812996 [Gymnopilus junonius]